MELFGLFVAIYIALGMCCGAHQVLAKDAAKSLKTATFAFFLPFAYIVIWWLVSRSKII